MKPHAFTPGADRTRCAQCGNAPAHSLHVAHDDVRPATDGAQAFRLIRGTKP